MVTTGTEPDGSFYFARVPPGRYRLTVRKDGYAAPERELDLVSSAEFSDLEVEVRATRGLTLEVRLASGGAPPYVTIAVLDPAGRVVLQESRSVGEQGEVRLPTVPAGRWQLMVSAPGTESETAMVSVPGDSVSLGLTEAGRLAVRVPALEISDMLATLTLLGNDRHPFRILDAARGLMKEWELTAGRTIVEGVPAGVWAVQVISADGQVWSGSALAMAGKETEVVLE